MNSEVITVEPVPKASVVLFWDRARYLNVFTAECQSMADYWFNPF